METRAQRIALLNDLAELALEEGDFQVCERLRKQANALEDAATLESRNTAEFHFMTALEDFESGLYATRQDAIESGLENLTDIFCQGSVEVAHYTSLM